MLRTAIFAALAALLANASAAQVVGVATDQQGSLGYNTGQAVAKVAVTVAGVQARVQPMAGTAAYLPLVNNGEMDFGFCNAVEAEYAHLGTGNFEGTPNPNLRMVGVMFPLRTGLMVAADSGIRTIADLKARAADLRIASEYTASTIIKHYIMGALANGGMTYDDFKQVPVSNFVKGMAALPDGLVDVTLISLNSAGAKEADAALRSRGGIRYVSLDASPEGQQRFRDFLSAASIVSLPANANIPGLEEGASIIEIPWVMVTNADVSDDLVYTLTKAVAENNAALVESLGAFRGWKKDAMAPVSKVPYHPGALRYYAEAGISVGQ